MNLFIIGNGFDLAHSLPTSYRDFRSYLLRKYPGCDEFDDLVPEPIMLPDGSIKYDENDIAGYITKIIDECEDDRWSDLETCLGNKVIDRLVDDLEDVSMDDSDKETMRAIYRNEDCSEDMKRVFVQIKNLFTAWVREDLSKINCTLKPIIAEVLSDGDAFLSFNYTKTLEEAYGKKNVCHIHGFVDSPDDEIIFGHGDVEEYPESMNTFGADINLNQLKRELRKDTHVALSRHLDFFQNLRDVASIHSFGFSFSDVDMIYIEEIAKRASGATWYFNSYDAGADDKKAKLQKLGFNVEVDYRW